MGSGPHVTEPYLVVRDRNKVLLNQTMVLNATGSSSMLFAVVKAINMTTFFTPLRDGIWNARLTPVTVHMGGQGRRIALSSELSTV